MSCGRRRKNRPGFPSGEASRTPTARRDAAPEWPQEPLLPSLFLYSAVLVIEDDVCEVISPTATPPKAPARMPSSTRIGNHSAQCLSGLRNKCILHTLP